jgi:DNA-binding CsgD family transcriptional regulator
VLLDFSPSSAASELSPFGEAVVALVVEHLHVSRAESDVARRSLFGETNAAMKQARNVKLPTVAKQLCNLYRRTDLAGRQELSTHALLTVLRVCEPLIAASEADRHG